MLSTTMSSHGLLVSHFSLANYPVSIALKTCSFPLLFTISQLQVSDYPHPFAISDSSNYCVTVVFPVSISTVIATYV